MTLDELPRLELFDYRLRQWDYLLRITRALI